MKEENGYKRRRIPSQGGSSENQKRNDCVTKNLNICISLREIYKNIPSSDLTEEYFLFKLFVLFILTPTSLL